MICGHCKTQNTSVAHVRACSQRRSEPSPVTAPPPVRTPVPMEDLTEKSMWQLPNQSARIGWDIYRVFIGADSRKPYVKVRTDDGWSYVPGGVRTLREHGQRLTPEVAKAFGDVYVTCCICGRDLTNPESIDYGIGPVCRAKDGVVTVSDYTLPSALQLLGWSAEPWDYCWLACDRAGYRKDVGGYMIVLCPGHIEELESSAQHGYSQADPPEGATRMPSVGTRAWDRWMDKYWWPWQLSGAVAGEDV